MDDDLGGRLRHALCTDDVDELVGTGCDLADAGHQEEALTCFRRAVALGQEWVWFNVGNTLRELDRPLEAIVAYEAALRAGETDAWLNHGAVLEEVGDLVAAMNAYRAAWERGGQPQGLLNLATLLREQGLQDEALAALGTAAEAGYPPAAARAASWRWARTRDPALEEPLRAGAAVDGDARADLADLLLATGRSREALEQLQLGAAAGQVACFLPLGNLLTDGHPDGDVAVDVTAAERAYRAGIAAGDTHCHHNLALLLLGRGETEAAEAHLLAGATAGDDLAQRLWRELHREDD